MQGVSDEGDHLSTYLKTYIFNKKLVYNMNSHFNFFKLNLNYY